MGAPATRAGRPACTTTVFGFQFGSTGTNSGYLLLDIGFLCVLLLVVFAQELPSLSARAYKVVILQSQQAKSRAFLGMKQVV